MRLLRTIARTNYSNLEHFGEFAADDELAGLDVLRTAIDVSMYAATSHSAHSTRCRPNQFKLDDTRNAKPHPNPISATPQHPNQLKSRSLVVDKSPLVPVVTEMGVCHSTTTLPTQRIRHAYADAYSECDECRTVLDTVMDGEDATTAKGCTALDSCLLEITPGKLEPVPLTLVRYNNIQLRLLVYSIRDCEAFSNFSVFHSQKKFIHHELDAANMFSNRLELLTMRTVGSVQLLVDWTVASERVADLAPQRRQCRYYAEPRAADHFPVYTRTLCEMSCRIESALRLCDCVPFFYALRTSAMADDDGGHLMHVPPATESCTVRGLYCLSQHNWFDVNVPWCRCPDECEQISFLVGQRVFYEVICGWEIKVCLPVVFLFVIRSWRRSHAN